MATLANLQQQTLSRIEELNPGAPVFWNLETEINSALVEGICDALLLVGRPDLIVTQPLVIQPNQWLQTVPKGVFCLLSLQGPSSEVWKVTLEDMDYSMVAGPDWEQDVGDTITSWFPVGFNAFGVHPVVPFPQTVLMTAIASPISGFWPYPDTTTVPVQDNFFVSLEKYASSYLRLKEGSAETQEGVSLYKDYLQDMKRMTELQDRIDAYLFEGATGGKITANPTTIR
jgi:hypothetical protein